MLSALLKLISVCLLQKNLLAHFLLVSIFLPQQCFRYLTSIKHPNAIIISAEDKAEGSSETSINMTTCNVTRCYKPLASKFNDIHRVKVLPIQLAVKQNQNTIQAWSWHTSNVSFLTLSINVNCNTL